MRKQEEKRREKIEETGGAVLESPYRVVKTLTYSDILAKYDFIDRSATQQAWIFFKKRFPDHYFDANYFDQWFHRFNQGYADRLMDYESLEIWHSVRDKVKDLIAIGE